MGLVDREYSYIEISGTKYSPYSGLDDSSTRDTFFMSMNFDVFRPELNVEYTVNSVFLQLKSGQVLTITPNGSVPLTFVLKNYNDDIENVTEFYDAVTIELK